MDQRKPPILNRAIRRARIARCAMLLGPVVLLVGGGMTPLIIDAWSHSHRRKTRDMFTFVALGIHHYAETMGTLPPTVTTPVPDGGAVSWRARVQPYIEHT